MNDTTVPTMPKFVHEAAPEMIKRGATPKFFWINSMGEYGHRFTNNVETIGGSINLADAAHAAGFTYDGPQSLPGHVVKSAYNRALHAELIHPLEYVVHRAWTHVDAMGSDLWRFYGEVQYADEKPVSFGLTMCIEYMIENTLENDLRELATISEAKVVHEDFDRPETHTQFGIEWDVMGLGRGSVAKLQAQWLVNSESLVGDKLVSVL